MIGDNLKYYTAYKPISNFIVSLIRSEKIRNNRFCIAISGESGCGKSTLAHSLKIDIETLSDYKGYIFHQDDYFFLPPKDNHDTRLKDIAKVGSKEVNLALLDAHIKKFKQHQDIEKPLVDYLQNGINSENVSVGEYDFCIVEGTYTSLLKQPDYKVFMSMDYEKSKNQRMSRSRDILDDFNEKVLKIEHTIIKEHAICADLIIDPDLNMIINN